jgi:TRAP-type C4-dicarboxylate transport system permease small subunit
MLPTAVRWVDRTIEALSVVALLAMLIAVMLGVITRAFDEPLIWTDELSRYLLVWVAALGWVIASRRRVHIRINFFVEMLPDRLHRVAEALIQAAVVLFGLLMIWQGFELVGRNYDLEATAMPISVSWLYMPLVLIGVFVVIQGAVEAAQALSGSGPVVVPHTEVIE